MRIIAHAWKWRTQPPPVARHPGVVWHHAAGNLSPEQVHQVHLGNGWSGIGYHYYVRLDGEIHQGRPLGTLGAHCLRHNDWVGVCAEGNYEARTAMPAAQLRSLQELHDYLHAKAIVGKADKKHRDMPGNATVCPGRHYPFAAVVKGAPASTTPGLVPAAKRCVLKQRMLWYAVRHRLPLDGVVGMAIVSGTGQPSNTWGAPAKKLAWRVSKAIGVKQSTQPTTELWRAL